MGLIVLVALLVFGATVRPASAHANLARAVPEPGASLDEPPDVIFAEFSEAVDPGFSRIDVLDSNGATVTSGASVPDPTSNTGLLVRVNDLPDGTYVVAWRTLSRIDGHLIRGSFTFGVGQPAAVISPSSQDD
jgi:copper transport protein